MKRTAVELVREAHTDGALGRPLSITLNDAAALTAKIRRMLDAAEQSAWAEAAFRDEAERFTREMIEAQRKLTALRARVKELEAPRSPSAFELACKYMDAWNAAKRTGSSDDVAHVSDLRLALVAYDNRAKS